MSWKRKISEFMTVSIIWIGLAIVLLVMAISFIVGRSYEIALDFVVKNSVEIVGIVLALFLFYVLNI